MTRFAGLSFLARTGLAGLTALALVAGAPAQAQEQKKFKVYHIKNDSRFEDITRAVHVPDNSYITIKPGEMVLGITRERITRAVDELADATLVLSDPLKQGLAPPTLLPYHGLDDRHLHLQQLPCRVRRHLGGHAQQRRIDRAEVAHVRHASRATGLAAGRAGHRFGAPDDTREHQVLRIVHRERTGLTEPAPPDDGQAQARHPCSSGGGPGPAARSPVARAFSSAASIMAATDAGLYRRDPVTFRWALFSGEAALQITADPLTGARLSVCLCA